MEVTSIFVLGASGDLAKKKTFPALFDLHLAGLLPAGPLRLCGYARSALSERRYRLLAALKAAGKAVTAAAAAAAAVSDAKAAGGRNA